MMVTRETTKATYDKLSRWYDWLAGPGEKKARRAGLRLLKAQAGERILEIGFGTGQALLVLAQAVGNSGQVYGIDLSEGMFHIAQAKVERAGLAERVFLQRGDVLKAAWKPNFFDAIFICFTLELFTIEEIPVVLRMCKDVLRRNGRVCIVAMSHQARPNLMMRLYRWAHHQFPHLVDCRPIDLPQLLIEADFTILQTIHLSMWGLPVAIVLAQPSQL